MFWRLGGTALAAWLALAAPAGPALHYHAEVSLVTQFSVDVWVEGDRARLDVQNSNDPNLAVGTTLLTADRGETLVVVNPARQEFFSLPRSVILGFKVREAERRHVTADPIASEKVGEDAGPELLGYPTRHLRFHLRLATRQPTASGELQASMEVFEHFWLTSEIPRHNTDLAMLSDSSATGVPSLDEFLRNQVLELPGFILKRTMVLTVDDAQNSRRVIRSAYEVTQLATADAAAGLFEVPEGFHERVPQGPAAPPR